jgi:hypothetical protein
MMVAKKKKNPTEDRDDGSAGEGDDEEATHYIQLDNGNSVPASLIDWQLLKDKTINPKEKYDYLVNLLRTTNPDDPRTDEVSAARNELY